MKKGKLAASFYYAWQGILYCIGTERNMKIHLVATLLVILLGLSVRVSKLEWLVLLLTIGLVLSLEMVNTALEKTVDLITTDWHPLAKAAKDLASGAVLLFSCIAAIIGLLIFLPYFL